jgi:hypothetical protein
MTSVIGDWPDSWQVVEVGDDPDIKQSESDGDEGYRIIPDHLADVDDVGNGNAAAILVQHIQEKTGPGEKQEYWNISIQSQHGIIGEKGMRGYNTQWKERKLSETEAQTKVDDIINDLQDVDKLRDVAYLNY